jgi:hypothetical protein
MTATILPHCWLPTDDCDVVFFWLGNNRGKIVKEVAQYGDEEEMGKNSIEEWTSHGWRGRVESVNQMKVFDVYLQKSVRSEPISNPCSPAVRRRAAAAAAAASSEGRG